MSNSGYSKQTSKIRTHSDSLHKAMSCGLGLVLSVATTNALAGGAAEFRIDGSQVTSTQINILASQSKSLRYNGGSNSCTEVEWYLRKEGESKWENFGHDGSARLEEIHRAGSHKLKMTARGYDGRYFFNLLGTSSVSKVSPCMRHARLH